MIELPSDTIAFFDNNGVLFGHLRIAPNDSRPDRIDCIFDFPEQLESPDPAARWLAKRHFQRWSEHRFSIDTEGVITIKKANFTLVLEPLEEGGFGTRPKAPYIFADWE